MANPTRHAPVVGRLRLARHIDGIPAALDAWRITTHDSAVADAAHRLLGGSAPQAWPSRSKDSIEVLTAATDLSIVVPSGEAYQTRYIRRNAEPLYMSTGRSVILPDGTRIPDPDRDLNPAERRRRARTTGEQLVTTLYFHLADAPDLGAFLFRSSSWDLAERFRRAGIRERLDAAGRNVPATLRLSHTPAGHAPLPNPTAQLLLAD